jgi:hypothetical protein
MGNKFELVANPIARPSRVPVVDCLVHDKSVYIRAQHLIEALKAYITYRPVGMVDRQELIAALEKVIRTTL